MIDERERFERAFQRFKMPDPAWDRLIGRRDRKRRNRRISAGVVGIAVFVALVWIVRDAALLERSEPSVPAVSGTTGPMETGPTGTGPTGPTETGPFYGLPPEGAEPSGPERGHLVDRARMLHVGSAYVYADGRVISYSEWPPPDGYREQRLTPHGVDLVRAGVIRVEDLLARPNQVTDSAWADPTMRPYVHYRYAICQHYGELHDLPAPAVDMLRGSLRAFRTGMAAPRWDCYDLTTARARALNEILIAAGFLDETGSFMRGTQLDVLRDGSVGSEPLAAVSFYPVLPHGAITHQLG